MCVIRVFKGNLRTVFVKSEFIDGELCLAWINTMLHVTYSELGGRQELYCMRKIVSLVKSSGLLKSC